MITKWLKKIDGLAKAHRLWFHIIPGDQTTPLGYGTRNLVSAKPFSARKTRPLDHQQVLLMLQRAKHRDSLRPILPESEETVSVRQVTDRLELATRLELPTVTGKRENAYGTLNGPLTTRSTRADCLPLVSSTFVDPLKDEEETTLPGYGTQHS